ncbi:hypothetical protein [Enterobacter sp. Z1]|uniref:hypothetical protein n=1 Tax=Enterobacter sp. Z1 TaxID=2561927 RepID=UPI001651CF99|nr:hypothetical protein [Enterobacter sp. Z1]
MKSGIAILFLCLSAAASAQTYHCSKFAVNSGPFENQESVLKIEGREVQLQSEGNVHYYFDNFDGKQAFTEYHVFGKKNEAGILNFYVQTWTNPIGHIKESDRPIFLITMSDCKF